LKIIIFVPTYGHQIYSQTAVSLVALTKELADRQIFGGCNALSFPDIEELRNVMLSIWYDGTDATHMLMVDSDMQFEPALIGDMLLADVPLIGCIYPTKRLPSTWVGSALTPEAQPKDGLLELEGIGCGVMLIRRDCVDQMIASGNVDIQTDKTNSAMFNLMPKQCSRVIKAFTKTANDEGRELSEDFALCYRHRKSGGKVYAAIAHRITHLGVYPFSGKYSDMFEAKPMDEAAE